MSKVKIRRMASHLTTWTAVLVSIAVSIVSCGDPFSSCDAHRSCPTGGKEGTGGAATEGGSYGGIAGAAGTAHGGADSGGEPSGGGNGLGGVAGGPGCEGACGGGGAVEVGQCLSGALRCLDNKTPSLCAGGEWIDQPSCSQPTPACNSGVCSAATLSGGLVAVSEGVLFNSEFRLADQGLGYGPPICGTVSGRNVCVSGGIRP